MWPDPQFCADLVTFTEEILNRKLHFLCSARWNVAPKWDSFHPSWPACVFLSTDVIVTVYLIVYFYFNLELEINNYTA